jgi:hypothetical protein
MRSVILQQVGGQPGRSSAITIGLFIGRRVLEGKGAYHALDNGLHRQLLTRPTPSIAHFQSFVRRPS